MEIPREKRKKLKEMHRKGARKVKTIPLLDYRTSVAAWALFEFSTTTLRVYCLVSTGLTLGPHPWLRPRPNLFIYALLRHHHPALKDSVNWLEIDFTDITRRFLVWEKAELCK